MNVSDMSVDTALAWAKENQIVIGLLASAVIGSMPETLPTFHELPQWMWTWLRESGKTFMNFRRPPLLPDPVPAVKPAPKPELPKPALPKAPSQLNG